MDGQATALMRVAAVLVMLEAVALLVLSVASVVTISPDRLVLGATNSVFFLLCAGGLGVCAAGLVKVRRWCRGPIVLAQILQLGIGWSFARRDTAWLAVGLTVPAVVVLAAVLAPSTTDALYGGDGADGG